MPIFTRQLGKAIGLFTLLSLPIALAGMLPLGGLWIVLTVLAIVFYGGGLYKLGLLHSRMLEAGE
jgi:hypothetical protein